MVFSNIWNAVLHEFIKVEIFVMNNIYKALGITDLLISRTLISGDSEAGFSIFWADDGLDTGPILLQQSCKVEPNDTVDTLYNRFLYPEGIKAMVKYSQFHHC